VSLFAGRRIATRVGSALVLANVRFWPTVAADVGRQLRRWERRAREIDTPHLRTLALEKLRDEQFNAQVAATLATLAPRVYRPTVVEAIVAYEVLYDYLDGRSELPNDDPLAYGRALYKPFTDAFAPSPIPSGRHFDRATEPLNDCYAEQLAAVVQHAMAKLPASYATREASRHAARRCAEAQVRAHAVPRLGSEQLEHWAATGAVGTGMPWQQFLAGAAASVLAVHALIAAAADDRTTVTEANNIDTTYLSICALSTMLDSLVDYDRDLAAGEPGFIRYYSSPEQLTGDVVATAGRAVANASELRNGPHHAMTTVGVVAYYLSAPNARTDIARPVTDPLAAELAPLMAPTLAVMRGWRVAKRVRRGRHRRAASVSDQTDLRAVTDAMTPKYVAIIADGNGRWAQARGLPVILGHEAGADTLRARIDDALALGVRELTVYSFSTENWSRSPTEVHQLIAMLTERITSESPALSNQGIRMHFLGRRAELPNQLVHQMNRAEALTAHNTQLALYIALNYGARAEIIDAAKRFHGDTEEGFRACMYAPNMHDPELLIRTGGEQRLSNYLLWQLADTELMFRQELWPDFTRHCFRESLAAYKTRSLARQKAAWASGCSGRSSSGTAASAGPQQSRLTEASAQPLAKSGGVP